MRQSKLKNQKFVIDADIACSAGDLAAHSPRSVNSRESLDNVRGGGHFVVLGHRLESQWDEHAGNYAVTWLVEMTVRGKVISCDDSPKEPLMNAILELDESRQAPAVKDAHLVQAALDQGQRILSFDRRARDNFTLVANTPTGEFLKCIHWGDLVHNSAALMQWLRTGAQDDRRLRLAAG